MKNCYDQREDIRQDNTVKPPLDSENNADMREEIMRILDRIIQELKSSAFVMTFELSLI